MYYIAIKHSGHAIASEILNPLALGAEEIADLYLHMEFATKWQVCRFVIGYLASKQHGCLSLYRSAKKRLA